ncbi:MAG: hypothetical protein ABIO72_04605 [Patescibacteria group bacterium]
MAPPLSSLYLFIGAFSLMGFIPFSLTSIGVCTLLCAAIWLSMKRSKTKDRAIQSISVVGIGSLLTWISLWISTRNLPGAALSVDVFAPIQKAGFPFIAFLYPPSPMGNDMPPFEMWLPFFLNLAFWTIVGWIIMQLAQKFLPNIKYTFIVASATILGVACSLIGLGYVVLKFD